ncbi:LPS export ABC transporter permease LptG [Solimonas sp. K1W22B-7]|uniref:LPS export ABC transporter permease LptG n=1 Tax=Solimonas sp. K1W22B-7 TaxID=2303331 RepID=UPI000E330D4B|nr:LPS export ABC transporter permease LptG [Solimonas sp. K1W22B-7]AXQ29700.1 LPS export ABC transporter permease LptG [Solimonas sp. K1W22B-7]
MSFVSRLDRYIMVHIFGLTAIAALALSAIYTFITFVSESGDIGKGDYGPLQLAGYVLWQIPTSLHVLLPIIALLGTLMGLGTLAAQNEITAMRAAGVSLLRIGRATLMAGLVIGAINLVLGDWLAPMGKQNATELREQYRRGRLPGAINQPVWLREGDVILHVGTVKTETEVADIVAYSLREDLGIQSIVHAEEASYVDGHWQARKVRRTDFSEAGAKVSELPGMVWEGKISPEVLRLVMLKSNAISIRGLMRLTDYLQANGLDDRQYRLELYRKLMAPFTVMAMMLFAVPFVMGSLRDSGTGQRLLFGILVGVAFYMANEVTANTGQIAGWPPILSAGLPTFLLGGIAAWRLARAR